MVVLLLLRRRPAWQCRRRGDVLSRRAGGGRRAAAAAGLCCCTRGVAAACFADGAAAGRLLLLHACGVRSADGASDRRCNKQQRAARNRARRTLHPGGALMLCLHEVVVRHRSLPCRGRRRRQRGNASKAHASAASSCSSGGSSGGARIVGALLLQRSRRHAAAAASARWGQPRHPCASIEKHRYLLLLLFLWGVEAVYVGAARSTFAHGGCQVAMMRLCCVRRSFEPEWLQMDVSVMYTSASSSLRFSARQQLRSKNARALRRGRRRHAAPHEAKKERLAQATATSASAAVRGVASSGRPPSGKSVMW